MTEREAFLYQLATGPILRSDAIVVLCGQDAEARTRFGVGQFATGAAPFLMLSGGRHDPPHTEGAKEMAVKAMALGVTPAAIVVEDQSQNTREQAEGVLAKAKEMSWGRLLLVASPYHLPRAFLTFLRLLKDEGKDQEVHVQPVPASHLGWYSSPNGQETRADLLGVELEKIDRYTDHVATYAEGLEYLRFWERGP
jgi:uncharacterized SAM-binding protein YcdF (DUF218 family)